MYKKHITILLLILLTGCSGAQVNNPVTVDSSDIPGAEVLSSYTAAKQPGFRPWGYFNFLIDTEELTVGITPYRNADVYYGYHMNVLKMLETDPCNNCLSVSNVHKLPDGDLSMDVTLTHPYSSMYPYCTGFDVRGIIMFPGSQIIPDNELRVAAGLDPMQINFPYYRLSLYEKGDAELMNPDGYTNAWHPVWDVYGPGVDYETGLPIFDYFSGKYSSGEDLATVNGYKVFYTTEDRHMFETGKADTQTYIIRPPDNGPIHASYAIYTHWAPPSVMPVTNPLTDFPPEANSPGPYRYIVHQQNIVDPDKPGMDPDLDLYVEIKHWDIGYEAWPKILFTDLLTSGNEGRNLSPYPTLGEDAYVFETLGYYKYKLLEQYEPDTFPGIWPGVFRLEIDNIFNPTIHPPGLLMEEFYIARIEFAELDGEW